MPDLIDPLVSRRMKAVRRARTAPELAVAEILSGLGVRFRSCVKSLPGTPDLANRRAGWVIFVHGCFWHGHRGCKLATVPKTNSEFWEAKLAANRRRDARKVRLLRAQGFRVFTVWQCETRRSRRLEAKLRKLLDLSSTFSGRTA